MPTTTTRTIWAALLCASVTLGCRQVPTQAPVDADGSTSSTALAAAVDSDTEPAACQPGRRFADYAWVPDDARLATSIQRDAPGLPAALTTLARMTEAPDLTLPVFAVLDFRNLPMQLGNLALVLDELGDDPAELIELHTPSGELVWLWPSNCPPALIAARVLERWQIMLRADLEHPGHRFGGGSVDGFPFDVITIGTLAEQRVALTRVGRGATIGAWLGESAHGGELGPGRALTDLDLSPVRSVFGGTHLLHHRVRVTSSDWDIFEPSAAP